MTSKALEPLEQKQVAFYEDTVTAVLIRKDGRQDEATGNAPVASSGATGR